MSGSIASALTVLVWNRRSDFHHAVLTENVRAAAGPWTAYQGALSAHGIGRPSVRAERAPRTDQAGG